MTTDTSFQVFMPVAYYYGVMEWHYNLAFIKRKDKLVPLCNLKKYHYLYLYLKWYIYSLCNSKNMPSRGLSRIHEVMFT